MEPPEISRDDGKRSDGLTLTPWAYLILDATCVDTLASTYVSSTSVTVRATASDEKRKETLKNECFRNGFIFVPIRVETFGA